MTHDEIREVQLVIHDYMSSLGLRYVLAAFDINGIEKKRGEIFVSGNISDRSIALEVVETARRGVTLMPEDNLTGSHVVIEEES